MKRKVVVLGAGSWGTTIGIMLYEKGFDVTLWEFNKERARALDKKRKLDFLLYLKIPKKITITSSINQALVDSCCLLIIAIPSHTVRSVIKVVAKLDLPEDMNILSVVKGFEVKTCERMTEVISAELKNKLSKRIAVLSGPSHAEEVSKKIPTSVVVASKNEKVALEIQKAFMSSYFRVYTSSDIKGVEIGGALKNVIAIAAGISDGMGMGDNSKAAIITRGLREIVRLGTAMGGKFSTFSGLSGVGDLIVTCTSRHSRNRNIGEKIGRGESLGRAIKEIRMVAEGVKSVKAVVKLAKKYNISTPIANEVYKVLYRGKKPIKAARDLMAREAKPEM